MSDSKVSENMKIRQDAEYLFALSVVERLQQAGYQAYFVGGCVRDMVMGLLPGDYDIATSARPQETLKLFPQAERYGIKYGILKVSDGRHKAQAGVFRRDDAVSDGRRPKRIYFAGLEEDAKRRDFTINAIYFDPITGELLDPVGGRRDIERRLIRVIGEARQRFAEDHLRILRAVRFASRFNYSIEGATEAAIRECAGWVEKISPERVKEELTRSFTEGDKVYALELLHNLGILAIFWDIFSNNEIGLYQKVEAVFSKMSAREELEVWMGFFQPWRELVAWREEVEKGMSRLNFSRKWKKIIYNRMEET